MPSRNSINRPKLTVNLNRKNTSIGKRRDQREKAGLLQPARSSADSKSGKVKSVPIELYFEGASDDYARSKGITTKTLSKKRAKKIERNLKYAQQRKLLTDATAQVEEGMDIDIDAKKKQKEEEKKTALGRVKDALWNAIGDATNAGLVLENGQGTTLGGPFFP
ncbi:Ribosome biogenesis protein ALB1 [Nakaseomyces bracarensis]|uniref:Ribosome biogenesis protein ALB1 n=1 Tax=Nakaseomyces bracarensis TaxID=273131 RepID=A0ABR4NRA1_9SACH